MFSTLSVGLGLFILCPFCQCRRRQRMPSSRFGKPLWGREAETVTTRNEEREDTYWHCPLQQNNKNNKINSKIKVIMTITKVEGYGNADDGSNHSILFISCSWNWWWWRLCNLFFMMIILLFLHNHINKSDTNNK